MKWLTDSLTGKDNLTYDAARLVGVIGAAAYIGFWCAAVFDSAISAPPMRPRMVPGWRPSFCRCRPRSGSSKRRNPRARFNHEHHENTARGIGAAAGELRGCPHPRSRCSRDLSLDKERCGQSLRRGSVHDKRVIAASYADSHITKPILSSSFSATLGASGNGLSANLSDSRGQ